MNSSSQPIAPPFSRVAVVDLGTNTVRLLVAHKSGSDFAVDYSGQTITRLGEKIHETGALAAAAIERTVAAIVTMWTEAGSPVETPLFVFGTSACRTASNAAELDGALKKALGVGLTIVDQEREGRLSLLGSALAVPDLSRFLLFDIGGGSTEYVRAENRELAGAHGTDLGVVRLTERYFTTHPVDPAEAATCSKEIEATVEKAFTQLGLDQPVPLVGTAGTVTSLAALDLGMHQYDPAAINGYELTVDAVAALREKIFPLSLAERSPLPSLGGGREDLIVPGILLVEATMRRAGIDRLTVADYGLREGYVMELLNHGTIR